MAELLTAAEMKAIETAAMDADAVTGLTLMGRAGAGVVSAIVQHWPDLAAGQRRAIILCGPGNNGGDGFVIARLLYEAGWRVEVFFFGHPGRLPPDARTNFDRWCTLDRANALNADILRSARIPGDCDILVDALFGTGLTRGIDLPLDGLGEKGTRHKTVAVDIPSGLCSDSGRVIGEDGQVVRADLTVSFHRAKVGHMLAEGPEVCGTCVVADIGL